MSGAREFPGAFETRAAEATEQLAAEFARWLLAQDGEGPAPLILLEGELGAGKTVFARGFVEGCGGDPRDVASPTYVILHHYGEPPRVAHADLYRLRGPADCTDLELASYPEAGIPLLIEWPDRLGVMTFPNAWRVRLDASAPDAAHRTVTIQRA